MLVLCNEAVSYVALGTDLFANVTCPSLSAMSWVQQDSTSSGL